MASTPVDSDPFARGSRLAGPEKLERSAHPAYKRSLSSDPPRAPKPSRGLKRRVTGSEKASDGWGPIVLVSSQGGDD